MSAPLVPEGKQTVSGPIGMVGCFVEQLRIYKIRATVLTIAMTRNRGKWIWPKVMSVAG